MKRRSLPAGLGLAVLLAGTPALAAETLTLKPSFPAAATAEMHVMKLGAESFENGPFMAQIPLDDAAVSAIDVSFAEDAEMDCGSGDIEKALTAPNATPSANATNDDTDSRCLFAASVVLTAGGQQHTIKGTCFDWENDATDCWVEGDAGVFSVKRDGPGAQSFSIVFDGTKAPAPAAGSASGAEGDTSGSNGDTSSDNSGQGESDGGVADWPENAILLGGLPQDSENPTEALWLTWPVKVISLSFTR